MSGRGLSTAFKDEVAKQELTSALFLHLAFDSGDVRMWSSNYDIDWGGNTWLGAGNLLKIGNVQETIDVRATQLPVTLSGIPSSLISIALGEHYQGRDAAIYRGVFSATTGALLENPTQIYGGIIDDMIIADSGEQSTITVSLETKLARLNQPNESRYTHSEQLSRYSNDDSFKFVAKIANQSIYWGDV